jgi:hypothetical protein
MNATLRAERASLIALAGFGFAPQAVVDIGHLLDMM